MSRHRKKKVESTVPSTYNYNQVRLDTRDTAKGQLISKGLFDVTVSTKKPMKFSKDFCPSLQKEFKSKNFIT